MRLKLVFILIVFSLSASAQKSFIVRAAKDSLDNFMPFYDMHEKSIKGMISIQPSIYLPNYWLTYAVQPSSKNNVLLDLYGDTLQLTKANFDFEIPINDTFVKSGNYRVVFRLISQIEELVVEEQNFGFQTLRKPNSFFKVRRKHSGSLITKRVEHSVSNIDVSQTFAAKYDLERIKKNIETLTVIAEKAEQGGLEGILKNDNLEELQRFFYNFWYARNPQFPEEEWKAYAEKLNYTARKYSYGVLKGYQTDRGRIYLKFGPPNREIRASSERGTNPYEVWFYNELDKYTNLNILFVQIGTIVNERVILHSSEPNFFFNPNWANQLFTDPSEQFNKNSHRVYEFFK